jgi:hypothetical protein
MKKFLVAVIIGVMISGTAWAFTAGSAFNTQQQAQNINVTADTNSMNSQIDQAGAGWGVSAAAPGSYGIEDQTQGEGIHAGGTNYGGNVYHEYNVDSMSTGGSGAMPGIAGHGEAFVVKGTISTNTDGAGTAVASGSTMSIEQETASAAIGLAGAGSATATDYESIYITTNAGPASYQVQTGVQKAHVETETGAGLIGAAGAEAEAVQAGGGVMSNSGTPVGTMKSTAGAYTAVDTATGAVGIAYGKSSASASQTHAGYQGTVAGGTYQYQSYNVSTGASESN